MITKGLTEGQVVVTDGQSRLQAGAKVAAQRCVAAGRRTGEARRLTQRGTGARMSISTPFIRRPVATSLLMAAFVLVGIAAYPLLPVAPLPRVDFPTISVTAKFPGASPETMAATVAQPLERSSPQIAGVAQMTSVSVLGTTQITLQFDLDRNIDAAAGDVQAAINAAAGQLPKNLPSPPTYRKVNPSDCADPDPVGAVRRDAADRGGRLRRQHPVRSRSRRSPASSQVFIGGEQKRAVRVQVDPGKLAAMGLTLEDVRSVLVNATVERAEGHHRQPSSDRSRSTPTTSLPRRAEYNNVILAYRNGAPVRVRDIGQAIDGPENAAAGRLAERQARHPADGVQAARRQRHRHGGAHQGRAAARCEAAIPPSIHVSVIMDRTLTIRASVHDVQFTLMLSISLVVMVIFLFLRNVWATIIPRITVPVALICTFAVMYLLGYSLDNLSLMALTIAVGFVVDDAIVMLENIYRHIEEGMKPMEAALKGAGEIGFTIVSISLLADRGVHPAAADGRHRRPAVPRVRHDGRRSRSWSPAFVSLTLTPMMCSRFLRHDTRRARLALPDHRGLLRRADRRLPPHAGYRAALPVHHPAGLPRAPWR